MSLSFKLRCFGLSWIKIFIVAIKQDEGSKNKTQLRNLKNVILLAHLNLWKQVLQIYLFHNNP